MGKIWPWQVIFVNFLRTKPWNSQFRSYCEAYVYYWPPLPRQHCYSAPTLDQYKQFAIAPPKTGDSATPHRQSLKSAESDIKLENFGTDSDWQITVCLFYTFEFKLSFLGNWRSAGRCIDLLEPRSQSAQGTVQGPTQKIWRNTTGRILLWGRCHRPRFERVSC